MMVTITITNKDGQYKFGEFVLDKYIFSSDNHWITILHEWKSVYCIPAHILHYYNYTTVNSLSKATDWT